MTWGGGWWWWVVGCVFFHFVHVRLVHSRQEQRKGEGVQHQTIAVHRRGVLNVAYFHISRPKKRFLILLEEQGKEILSGTLL